MTNDAAASAVVAPDSQDPNWRALEQLLPSRLRSLAALALDLRWTWSHAGDALWKAIDEEGWDRTQNPYAILKSQTPRKWEAMAADSSFVQRLDTLASAREAYRQRPAWWQGTSFPEHVSGIAYFSMEFGIAEALPLYAGGLGVLAGDLLKTASDLGVPVVGIGLLYRQGYFRQRLDVKGNQQALYVYTDSADLPISPMLADDGGPLAVMVELPGRKLRLRVWRAQIGRSNLYLLDSNDPWNHAPDRGITGRLYPTATEERLQQEIVLGVGGWRLVEALGLSDGICHLNEGHAAFAALERARCLCVRAKLDFHGAFWATRAGNVFTTHTAVSAAFDVIPTAMVERYSRALGFGPEFDAIAAMGRAPSDRGDDFNMAYLATRCCGSVNAVSKRHRQVSQTIFAPLYPRWPLAQVPMVSVTNGVHMPSWDSIEADALWTQTCGVDRWLGPTESHEIALSALDDAQIWHMRGAARERLVDSARLRVRRQREERGELNGHWVLDANTLTIGFARRFADYKRNDLLLREADRLARLLTHPQRPIQLVIAGKAHPDDEEGQAQLRGWADFARQPGLRGRVVILEDYDLALAEPLVQGMDVWVNTPRPPWEACGTSGMKVLVNGGLNLSSMDGWWLEAYSPDVGWTFGNTPMVATDPDARDASDAREILDLIEHQIVPSFYERDASGLPRKWIERIRSSMARLAPRYNANRMLREYVAQLYVPAAAALSERRANGYAQASQLKGWADSVERSWEHVHVNEPQLESSSKGCQVRVTVYLGEVPLEAVAVQLYADGPGMDCSVISMERQDSVEGSRGGHIFAACVQTEELARQFTPRVVAYHGAALLPQELPLIRWPR